MLRPEEAWEIISSRLRALPSCRVPRPAAVGCVLSENVEATVDQPPADVSAMDGYVLAGAAPPETTLPVIGRATAGRPAGFTVPPGNAAKIMTGAVVPRGADRVLPIEQTDGGDRTVTVHATVELGAHIRRQAEVIAAGDPLLSAGTLLTPGAISLLSSHGYREVAARRPPTVAVLSTGDEVVTPETDPGPGQLRDSNSPFLLAAGQAMGLAFRHLGIAPDRADILRERIADGLDHDVLLLCGGVSMGELDLVGDALTAMGCETLLDRVAIQPGKPLVVARAESQAANKDGCWICGLPGNPASVMVTYWLFVRPLLRRLMGRNDHFWHGALKAELAAPLPASKDRDRFLPAEVHAKDGRLLVTPCIPRGSHDVSIYARGTALVRITPSSPAAEPGEMCEILPLIDGFAMEEGKAS